MGLSQSLERHGTVRLAFSHVWSGQVSPHSQAMRQNIMRQSSFETKKIKSMRRRKCKDLVGVPRQSML